MDYAAAVGGRLDRARPHVADRLMPAVAARLLDTADLTPTVALHGALLARHDYGAALLLRAFPALRTPSIAARAIAAGLTAAATVCAGRADGDDTQLVLCAVQHDAPQILAALPATTIPPLAWTEAARLPSPACLQILAARMTAAQHNAPDAAGRTALHYACYGCRIRNIVFLLELGVTPVEDALGDLPRTGIAEIDAMIDEFI